MSDKDLQRVTECVSYIGQGSARRRPPPVRRHYSTQKIKIVGQRILSLSVHDDARAWACPGHRADGRPTMISSNQDAIGGLCRKP